MRAAVAVLPVSQFSNTVFPSIPFYIVTVGIISSEYIHQTYTDTVNFEIQLSTADQSNTIKLCNY
jgi:hypothetical protein